MDRLRRTSNNYMIRATLANYTRSSHSGRIDENGENAVFAGGLVNLSRNIIHVIDKQTEA